MLRKSISMLLMGVLLLALLSLACNAGAGLPVREVETGELQTDEIQVAPVDAELAQVVLSFGAGELNLEPGDSEYLLSGSAEYNVPDFKPKVVTEGDTVRLEMGKLNVRGIPNFKRDLHNIWDLRLGTQPMALVINGGAYQGEIELGGLSLQSLEVGDGAADVELSFSEPNLVEMEILRYETGASNVELTGLANANFTEMKFTSGAGEYTLDFSGELQRDATVNIEAGISQVTIIVPEGMRARVVFEGGISSVKASGSWEKSGGEYTLAGEGSLLTIYVDMGAGNLELKED